MPQDIRTRTSRSREGAGGGCYRRETRLDKPALDRETASRTGFLDGISMHTLPPGYQTISRGFDLLSDPRTLEVQPG
jgi:hypothetical protein